MNLRQIYFEMKHQKMMTWVSVSGTALAIFLVMIFFMTDNVRKVETAPETRRSETLVGLGIHVERIDGKGNQNGGVATHLGYKRAKSLYDDLEGVEKETFQNIWTTGINFKSDTGKRAALMTKKTDGAFWKFYDFNFIEGVGYDEASADAGELKMVLSRTGARKLFNTGNAVGRKVSCDGEEYVVVGVVEDANPLLLLSFAECYVPFGRDIVNSDDDFNGGVAVALLPEKGVDIKSIQSQVKGRYAALNTAYSKNVDEEGYHWHALYHDSPWPVELWSTGTSIPTNETPKAARSAVTTWFIYGMLLLIPALNLSSMTNGRLRHRVAEIGVRRAFGAKRSSIVTQLLGENLIVTLLGGILGLAACCVFMLAASPYFFQMRGYSWSNTIEYLYLTPSFSMLFTWKTFFVTLLACFGLNILSATVPAWRASRVQPAVAISKSKIS